MEVPTAGHLDVYFWILQGRTCYGSVDCINTSVKGHKRMQQ